VATSNSEISEAIANDELKIIKIEIVSISLFILNPF
jgi:hypothetical protein